MQKIGKMGLSKEIVAKKYFKNRCYVCHKKYGKYFLFHHLWYIENDVIYKHYKNTITYNEALMPLVIKNKKRFLLLCRAHHKYVEWASSIKNKDMWKRFIKARTMTKT